MGADLAATEYVGRTDNDKVEGLVGDVGDRGKLLVHVELRLLLGERKTLELGYIARTGGVDRSPYTCSHVDGDTARPDYGRTGVGTSCGTTTGQDQFMGKSSAAAHCGVPREARDAEGELRHLIYHEELSSWAIKGSLWKVWGDERMPF